MATSSPANDIFAAWQKAIASRDWSLINSYLTSDVTYNEGSAGALQQELKATWEAVPDHTSEVDMTVVDKDGKAITARVIHSGVLVKSVHGIEVTDRPVEWSEHIMIWTSEYGGKISRILTLIDTQHQATTETLPRTPSTLVQRPPPPGFDLRGMYNAYLEAVNGPSVRQELPRYFQEPLIHTAKEWSLEAFAGFLETSPTLFEGLNLSVADFMADPEGHQVAVRLLFSGVPVKPFFGLGPPAEKKKVEFYEHAIYKLDGDKHKFIWAMLDLVSYEKQVKD